MNEFLEGGRTGIYKHDDFVFRPTEIWTEYIHLFLRYLHSQGFDKAPFPFGIDKVGIEKISYLKGNVYNELLPEDAKSDEALISLSILMKQFHDIGEEYAKKLTGKEKWMLPPRSPNETMCHGDLAPYNIVMEGKKVIGIIDFDTLHPGPRMWDIAYSLYRWIPLMSPDNPENFGSEEDKHRRLSLFINTYGLDSIDNQEIIQWVVQRLEYLVSFMEREATSGNITFKKHIENGHLEQYQRDLKYLELFWG
ncbi:aminoglycoside phosphotransferase family protein [Vallitalea okinawensis]|uniref:aminoglycoside phosphotransferase family protein n=1 Tax=Vallitalea okinawensis TaxID=2078660 RepID=UPI001300B7A0|nr:aminoglycoside phosphotransferase family protein [Vallitalea okinawensis]